jgi:RNA polymerase sigma factor (sigma-70 family)
VNLFAEKDKFVTILKENKGILLKVIRSYCKSTDDWKDLEQEIIIQLWKSFKNYNPTYKLSTWIYRISLNVAISHYRKEIKRNHIGLDEKTFNLPIEEIDEDMSCRKQTLYNFINVELDGLSKALIILYLEDHGYSEIAVILGITESNVATKINRIKNKFKQYVNK